MVISTSLLGVEKEDKIRQVVSATQAQHITGVGEVQLPTPRTQMPRDEARLPLSFLAFLEKGGQCHSWAQIMGPF